MRVIGLNGFKQSGKGETARCIETLCAPEYNIKCVGFADKLKVLAAKSLGFGLTNSECIALMDSMKNDARISVGYKHEGKHSVQSLSGRQFLQNYGNYMRELFGEDVWINAVLPVSTGPLTYQSALRAMHPGVDILVLTDLRYENEADRVHQMDGEIWEVIRPGRESDGHISERPLPRPKVDRIIPNDSDLASLAMRVYNELARLNV